MEQPWADPAPILDPLDGTDDRYVVLSASGDGWAGATASDPMTFEEARGFLAQMTRGEPSEDLLGPIDLVVELEPGHLLVGSRFGSSRGAIHHEIRIARVLFNR